MVKDYINEKQIKILKDHFIYFKNASIENLLELSQDNNKYFFDTENSPIFPSDIVEKYNLTEVEYHEIEDFKIKDNTDNYLLKDLLKENKITTDIYIWMFGASNSNNVYWGNTFEEFINFIESINIAKIEHNTKQVKINDFEIFVHNLTYDNEFLLYYLKEFDYKQLKVSQDKKAYAENKKIEFSFDVTQANNTIYNATLQYRTINIIKKRTSARQKKDKQYEFITRLVFKDSLKITSSSLKTISKKFIDIDDIYKKDGSEYKYNLVRDNKNYVPSLYESWYQYCDIYILIQWYNQFIKEHYIKNGIKNPNTISQIAFDLILKESLKDIDRSKYIGRFYNGKEITKIEEITDKMIYDFYFELDYISKRPWIEEILWHSYKGGHCTASRLYAEKSESNEVIKGVSCDITSSYPGQCVYKPLPYGIPKYYKGKPLDNIIDSEDNKKYDYHFVTIAFDGWTPKESNFNNQFGLNVKLRLSQEEKKKHKIPTNETVVSNFDEFTGEILGCNRIEVRESKRKKLVNSYSNNFVITVPYNELLEWLKDYDFWTESKNEYINDVLYIDTLSFKSDIGFFAKGILHYYKEKDIAELEGNEPKRQNAKLIINSFYGKNGSRRDREQRFYNFDSEVIRFHKRNEEEYINNWIDKKIYAVHYASAVTSYGRIQLRATARALGNDKFIYADTDSLKLCYDIDELKDRLEIYNSSVNESDKIQLSFRKEDKKLGAWDFEYEFEDFKVIGQKKYMYKVKGSNKFSVKCAGLSEDIREQIQDKKDFSIGKTFIKKSKRKVKGGYLLIDNIFSINDLLLN